MELFLSLEKWLIFFLCEDDLSQIFQNITIAIITVYLAFLIPIFEYFVSKVFDNDANFSKLDLYIVLDKVINIKILGLGVFLSLLPTLFWFSLDESYFRIVLFSSWVVGTCILLFRAGRFYPFIKYKEEGFFEYRKNYLEELEPNADSRDLFVSWRSIWSRANVHAFEEARFLELFMNKIQAVWAEKRTQDKCVLLQQLLNDFLIHLDKRNVVALVGTGDFLTSMLELHFEVWHYSRTIIKDDDINLWGECDEVFRLVKNILSEIFFRTVSESQTQTFLIKLKKHLDIYKNEFIKSNRADSEYSYTEFTIQIVTSTLFERVPYKKTVDILRHQFIEEWKVNGVTLNGDDSVIVRNIFSNYLRWMEDMLSRVNSGKYIDLITDELITDIDPISWGILLTFVYSGDLDVTNLVKDGWKIGHLGRVEAFWGNDEDFEGKIVESRKNQRRVTLRLVVQAFPSIFSKKRIIDSLQKLNEFVSENDIESGRVSVLIDLFNELKSIKN